MYLLVGVRGADGVQVVLLTRPESAAIVPRASVMRKRYCTAPLAYVSPPPVTTNVGVKLEVLTLFGDCATGALALSDEPPIPPAASFRLVVDADGAIGVEGVDDVGRHASEDATSAARTRDPKSISIHCHDSSGIRRYWTRRALPSEAGRGLLPMNTFRTISPGKLPFSGPCTSSFPPRYAK